MIAVFGVYAAGKRADGEIECQFMQVAIKPFRSLSCLIALFALLP
jgi:hypothetical protein